MPSRDLVERGKRCNVHMSVECFLAKLKKTTTLKWVDYLQENRLSGAAASTR